MVAAVDTTGNNHTQKAERFSLYVRIVVYSYLETDEILVKASKLCKIDRKKLRDSELITSSHSFTLKV